MSEFEKLNKLAAPPANALPGTMRPFVDMAGTLKMIDENGVVTTVGGGGGPYAGESWVQAESGSDAGDGTFGNPWKTLEYAATQVSGPWLIHATGRSDQSAGPIALPGNVDVVAPAPGFFVNQNVTIGGSGNDLTRLVNLQLFGSLSWVRNDGTALQLWLLNTEIDGGVTFQQTGAGMSSSYLWNRGGAIAGNLDTQCGSVTLVGAAIYGPFTYADSGVAYLTVTATDFASAISLSGGVTAFFTGCVLESGTSIATATTGSGTPTIQTDSAYLQTLITGPYALANSVAAKGSQVFLVDGTFTVPPGVTKIDAAYLIAGGGGAGGNSGAGGGTASAGGSCGQQANAGGVGLNIIYRNIPVTPGDNIAVVVGQAGLGGAGGAGGAANADGSPGSDGTSGTPSSFGIFSTGFGGNMGTSNPGGTAGGGSATPGVVSPSNFQTLSVGIFTPAVSVGTGGAAGTGGLGGNGSDTAQGPNLGIQASATDITAPSGIPFQIPNLASGAAGGNGSVGGVGTNGANGVAANAATSLNGTGSGGLLGTCGGGGGGGLTPGAGGAGGAGGDGATGQVIIFW